MSLIEFVFEFDTRVSLFVSTNTNGSIELRNCPIRVVMSGKTRPSSQYQNSYLDLAVVIRENAMLSRSGTYARSAGLLPRSVLVCPGVCPDLSRSVLLIWKTNVS